MGKPFLKLGDVFGVKPSQELTSPEKACLFKVKDWEELSREVTPLFEENLVFREPPKVSQVVKDRLQTQKIPPLWPPDPFEISLPLTSEYIEGKKDSVSNIIFRRLKEGKFSVKAVLNLRRMTADEALTALEEFFKRALMLNYSCVLVIHGRGLSSPGGKPVLKPLFKNWLERGPFRKHVLAFASARPCDGGLGATYVLLSHRPVKR